MRTTESQNLSSQIPCPTFTPTAILGNPTALQDLLDWCVTDTRCEEYYGQVITEKLDLFDTLFQVTTHSYSGTLYLESPLVQLCDGNYTWNQMIMLQWIRSLKLDILERGKTCNEGDQPIGYNNVTNELSCGDIPWLQSAQIGGFNALGLTIEILIVILLVIVTAVQIWTFQRRSKAINNT